VVESDELLVVRDLAVTHAAAGARARVTTLDGVSFELRRGGTLAIVGESGAGKSTLVQAIAGVLPRGARVAAGSIRFAGRELVGASAEELRRVRGRELAVVFQDPLAAFDPVLTVGAQVEEMLRAHGVRPASLARARVLELFARCSLADPERVARSYPHELSGGMRQRAQVACALALGPRLVLADEPTSALDPPLAASVLALFESARVESGTAVLYVTHDLALAARHAERVAVFLRGRLVEEGPVADVLARPVHPHTRALVAAARELRERPAGDGTACAASEGGA
jgi:ABC-type glutathione transport system ATPase component